jgi:hypothetical protein
MLMGQEVTEDFRLLSLSLKMALLRDTFAGQGIVPSARLSSLAPPAA